jgi:hypothetical protein
MVWLMLSWVTRGSTAPGVQLRSGRPLRETQAVAPASVGGGGGVEGSGVSLAGGARVGVPAGRAVAEPAGGAVAVEETTGV